MGAEDRHYQTSHIGVTAFARTSLPPSGFTAMIPLNSFF